MSLYLFPLVWKCNVVYPREEEAEEEVGDEHKPSAQGIEIWLFNSVLTEYQDCSLVKKETDKF